MNIRTIFALLFTFLYFSANGIVLSGTGDSYIFEGIFCSEVDTSEITIDGRTFDPTRDRLSIYGNGSIVIADGWENPLIIYSDENCSGKEKILTYDCFYRSELQGEASTLPEESLGDFDNAIRSFKLKRGFSCTMANNPDGTGYSRVFIADDEDLIVNSMPDGLCFVSFVRVCRFDWVGKRGVSGELAGITRSSWYYDWGAAASSTADYEYIPMRHNQWWDSWENIGTRTSTSAVLGFNEPDHADQADLGTEVAIALWPEMMKSGLRVGSPAPDTINKDWLKEFLAKADSLNYRVDFVATHMYWNSQDPYTLAQTISNLCQNEYGGRPMWITELNNGANWTSEWWPDASGPQRDAEFNIIYDENGNTTTVARPHTEGNSAVQVSWLTKALDAFDNCEWLERHAFFNWVEDARAIVLDDKLTPAGKVFADYNSRPAFNRNTEYVHEWRIAPPRITQITASDSRVRINFVDNNGETGKGYRIERRINGGDWQEIDFITEDDYRHGTSTYFRDFDLVGGLQEYRFKALSYLDTESIYSRVVGIDIKNSYIDTLVSGEELEISCKNGKIVINADNIGTLEIYRVDGSLFKRVMYQEGKTEVSMPQGIYIANRRKLIL